MNNFRGLERSLGGACSSNASSSIMTEVLVQGHLLSTNMNINHLVVEDGCLTLNNTTRKTWKIPWKINNIINDINFFSNNFSETSFIYCLCNANQAAYFIFRGSSTILMSYIYFLETFILSSVRII